MQWFYHHFPHFHKEFLITNRYEKIIIPVNCFVQVFLFCATEILKKNICMEIHARFVTNLRFRYVSMPISIFK